MEKITPMRLRREMAGLSLDQVAARPGMPSREWIRQYEMTEKEIPAALLRKLARLYGCEPQDIREWPIAVRKSAR